MDLRAEDKLFVERAYKVMLPYSVNMNNETYARAIQRMFDELEYELCNERFLPMLVAMAAALDLNPTPEDNASTICDRIKKRLHVINENLGLPKYNQRYTGSTTYRYKSDTGN